MKGRAIAVEKRNQAKAEENKWVMKGRDQSRESDPNVLVPSKMQRRKSGERLPE